VYRSGNPALSNSTFEKNSYKDMNWWDNSESNLMTIEGVAEKTAFLLLITATSAIATAMMMPGAALLCVLGFIGSLICLIMVMWSKSNSPLLICSYALFEGLLLGGITWIFEVSTGIEGLGIISAGITFLILGVMITIYRLGLIHWDKNMQIAVTSSMMAIMLIYLISILGSFLGYNMPYIHGSGTIGIAFSVFVVGIASLCLVADFDFIERGVLKGAPKQLEWRAAFGLLVTLAWLYLEILKLVSKIAASRN
jgi:uncharacterized YccA/Bax inhibitor family protein|tara:strand:- start:9544 stop:10302 length:759 start_codon:yes stop_codon:yes gene_type:complete